MGLSATRSTGAGLWASSLALENFISQRAGAAEVAVIGVRDITWGERPLALVVPSAGLAAGEEEIRAFVGGFAERGVISRYAVPRRVLLVKNPARTDIDKLDKKRLREQFDTISLMQYREYYAYM
jgi:fatty-acyl-CoA synthase